MEILSQIVVPDAIANGLVYGGITAVGYLVKSVFSIQRRLTQIEAKLGSLACSTCSKALPQNETPD